MKGLMCYLFASAVVVCLISIADSLNTLTTPIFSCN